MSNPWVLASSNQGKLAEFNDCFVGLGIEVIAQSQFVPIDAEETGSTFVENAIIKARHACSASGLQALADDSGLTVDALQGAPGVGSARFAMQADKQVSPLESATITGTQGQDAANNAKLLHVMKNVLAPFRTARFHCALVLMRHADDPVPLICQGVWEGYILEAPQGDNGFGYDPLFAAADTHICAAAMSKAEKMQVSHRGKALALLMQSLQANMLE